jgi:hypothetical protein
VRNLLCVSGDLVISGDLDETVQTRVGGFAIHAQQ